MKKVKVESYKNSDYSALKMVTGKILPAGLVVATVIAGAANTNVYSGETEKDSYSVNEKIDFTASAGGAPAPTMEKIDIPVLPGAAPAPIIGIPDFPAIAGGIPDPTMEITEEKLVKVLVNQEAITFDVEPVLENGRVLVPLRKIFESLEALVSWDDETKTATAIKGGHTIVVGVNDTKMLKNGEEIILDVATKIVDGRILVPLRAVSEGLGCVVSWDEIDKQVIIECEDEPEIFVTAGIPPLAEN